MNDIEILTFRAVFCTNPEGARIVIDGIDTGKTTPASIDNLSPEIHRFDLFHEGYEVAGGNFNSFSWRDFTARINLILTASRKLKLSVGGDVKLHHRKYDPLNPRTWRVCPNCGIKIEDRMFRHRKHESECRNCGKVFKVLCGSRYLHPLDPSKDPNSLFFSKKLPSMIKP